jgi:hypothetical protein
LLFDNLSGQAAFSAIRMLSDGFLQPGSKMKHRAAPNLAAFKFPKLFLRLLTKMQGSDSPITMGKWFFDNLLVDYKGLEFYHRH